MSETCKTCRWWVRGWMARSGQAGGSVGYVWQLPQADYPSGECRRWPPTRGLGARDFSSTLQDDWCGEHTPKEKPHD